MVLKNKQIRDSVKTSCLAKRNIKSLYKGHRKDNYKKNKVKLVECCICFKDDIQDITDNTIFCGKIKHTICGDCKVQMKNSDCPMCRSHPVPQPVAQDHILKTVKKLKKTKSIYSSDISRMSPKNIRNYNR